MADNKRSAGCCAHLDALQPKQSKLQSLLHSHCLATKACPSRPPAAARAPAPGYTMN